MEPRYVILMDFSTGELIKIRLSDEQLKASEDYDFRFKDCLYMTCHNLSERNYNL